MGFQNKYTPEQKEFFKSCKGISYKNGCELFEKTFNQPITLQAYKRQIREVGGNGLDGKYRKGNQSYKLVKSPFRNTGMENGTEVYRERGHGVKEMFVKVDGRWIAKKKLVWEEHHGSVPPDHEIWFLDGNHQNCSIENLILLKKSEALEYTRRKYNELHPAYRQTAIALSKLNCAIREKER